MVRTIHIIWIGDERKQPSGCIASWRTKNPRWTVKVWGNEDLLARRWVNSDHMTQMGTQELNGVADMMRYEILHAHGGFAVDADSMCVRPLEDWLFEPSLFACWESELHLPGTIATGYVYAAPQHPFIAQVIEDIRTTPSVKGVPAWKCVGPRRLTESFKAHRPQDMTIYPSHYFLPSHYRGGSYNGTGQVFAEQFWASTRGAYGNICKETP